MNAIIVFTCSADPFTCSADPLLDVLGVLKRYAAGITLITGMLLVVAFLEFAG
jgi:hypothetical protein